jgi:hypothetical protein
MPVRKRIALTPADAWSQPGRRPSQGLSTPGGMSAPRPEASMLVTGQMPRSSPPPKTRAGRWTGVPFDLGRDWTHARARNVRDTRRRHGRDKLRHMPDPRRIGGVARHLQGRTVARSTSGRQSPARDPAGPRAASRAGIPAGRCRRSRRVVVRTGGPRSGGASRPVRR